MCKFQKYIVGNTWYLGYQVGLPWCLCRQIDSFVTSSIQIFRPAELGQMQRQDIHSYKNNSSSLQEKKQADEYSSFITISLCSTTGCIVMISEPVFNVISVILHQITLHIKKASVIFEGIFSLRLHSSLISLCHSPIHLSYPREQVSIAFHEFRERIRVVFDGLTAFLCIM